MARSVERAPDVLRAWRDWADAAPDELSTACVVVIAPPTAGGPLSQMIVVRIGQGVSAVPDEATAFSHRDARYMFHPISQWSDPGDDERLIEANRAFAAAMRPFSTGASYLNFTLEGDRVRYAYGEEK